MEFEPLSSRTRTSRGKRPDEDPHAHRARPYSSPADCTSCDQRQTVRVHVVSSLLDQRPRCMVRCYVICRYCGSTPGLVARDFLMRTSPAHNTFLRSSTPLCFALRTCRVASFSPAVGMVVLLLFVRTACALGVARPCSLEIVPLYVSRVRALRFIYHVHGTYTVHGTPPCGHASVCGVSAYTV